MQIKEVFHHLGHLEALITISHLTNFSKTEIITNFTLNLDSVITNKIQKIILQRKSGMPLSKIIGIKSFWNSDFIVDKNVLDPRTDSETIIDAILQNCDKNQAYNILDLGTGSGCLIISLLQELKYAYGTAIDISLDALKIAKENAKNLQMINHIQFQQSNWFNDIDLNNKLFDIVVSNPPYIKTKDIKYLSKEVKNYDPFISLDGGYDGLSSYRRIIFISYHLLKRDGILALEHGYNQQSDVVSLSKIYSFSKYCKYKDLSNNDRVLLFFK